MGTISVAELEATTVELLPSRETLAWINIANINAVNLAIAVNAGAALVYSARVMDAVAAHEGK